MKIAFFSAISFGAQGSPGTYKFIENCLKLYEVRIFAPLHGKTSVHSSKFMPIIPVENLSDADSLTVYLGPLLEFNPDIIYIFNFPHWGKLIESISTYFPDKKFILDIKSPLLAEGSRKIEIQEEGKHCQHLLDAIVTLAESNVPSWIPKCKIKAMVYPLAIDLSSFDVSDIQLGRKKCAKFIYIGTIHPQRQLDLLVKAFFNFSRQVNNQAILDIYGTGPDLERLRDLVLQNYDANLIRFKGLCPQSELHKKLCNYDVGIAYVPYEKYNASPSLKILEYMAAGIPTIASDTEAHTQLTGTGFSIDFFSNNIDSMVGCFMQVFNEGVPKERIVQNLQAIKKFDHENIIINHFMPFFAGLMNEGKEALDAGKDAPPSAIKKIDKARNQFKTRQKPCVLYIGPLGFKQGIWETRASYILPDLFDPIVSHANICMLTGLVPDFAKPTLLDLCNRYNIKHYEPVSKRTKETPFEYWQKEIDIVVKKLKPDILTNIFAPATVGFAMASVGKKAGARVVVRVAGDEIGSRLAIGTYGEIFDPLDKDLAFEAAGYRIADAIIVMSPWEKNRIAKKISPLDLSKVKICIRGVDLSRFTYEQRDYNKEKVRKILYIGRKSLEKGYDIVERVADSIFSGTSEIEFIFAGSFDREHINNKNYIGWVNSQELDKVFRRADAFLLPSRSEGFPQVLAEAMAVGLPSILPEGMFGSIFKNEIHAMLTSLDVQDVTNAIMKLHGNPELANFVSKESRIFAQEKLDKNLWADQYRNILLDDSDVGSDLLSVEDDQKQIPERNESGDKLIDRRRDSHIELPGSLIPKNNYNLKNRKSVLFLVLPGIDEEIIKNRIVKLIDTIENGDYFVYLAYPNYLQADAIKKDNFILIPYPSLCNLSYLIQYVELDAMVFLVTGLTWEYRNLFFKDHPLIVCLLNKNQSPQEKNYATKRELISDLWKQDLLLSNATQVLIEKNYPINIHSEFVGMHLSNLTDENNLEKIVTDVVQQYKDPERLFHEHFQIDPEKALHARRMRQRFSLQ